MRTAFLGLALLASVTGCGAKQEFTTADMIRTLKEHKDPDMRGWAARELGRLPGGDAAGVQPLTEALRDPDKNVRMAAAYALADLGPAAAPAVPALHKARQDEAVLVRDAAAYALKQIQRKK
jgi:HEAT repeat protein